MRDLVILSGIFMFWVLYGILIFAMAQDTTLQNLGDVNNTYITPKNITTLDNASNENTIPIFQSSYESKSKTGVDIILGFATFGISNIEGTPSIIVILISALNYFLVIITLLLVYRLIRHGGG